MENTSTSPNSTDPTDAHDANESTTPPQLTDSLQSQPDSISESAAAQPLTPPVSPETPAVQPQTTAEPAAEPLAPSPAPTSSPEPNAPQFSDPLAATPVAPEPPRTRRSLPWRKLLLAGVGLVLLGGSGVSSYALGKHSAKAATVSMTAQQMTMAVPKGATVIEQCTPGFGTQYVLPKDIPGGPVYNVYQGKLIGIEYMTDLATNDKLDLMLKNLPLFAQKYDHLDIMAMPAHAGYPRPHYQVDVMMVSTAASAKITCGSSTSSDMGSSMNTSTNSAMDKSTMSNSTGSM